MDQSQSIAGSVKSPKKRAMLCDSLRNLLCNLFCPALHNDSEYSANGRLRLTSDRAGAKGCPFGHVYPHCDDKNSRKTSNSGKTNTLALIKDWLQPSTATCTTSTPDLMLQLQIAGLFSNLKNKCMNQSMLFSAGLQHQPGITALIETVLIEIPELPDTGSSYEKSPYEGERPI